MNQPTNTAQPRSKAVTGKMVSIDVQITDASGHVDQPSVKVTKDVNEVRWFANGSEKATIVFAGSQGSPFTDNVFNVPPGGSVATGAAKTGVVYDIPYKYTVAGPVSANDPEVIIVR